MKHTSLVFGLSLLVGCNANNGDAIDLEWKSGQEFHVAAKYRIGAVRTEEGAVSLDGAKDRDFGEQWTEDVVWTYQVVETGFVPAPSDELYEYAETHDGVASLAVTPAPQEAGGARGGGASAAPNCHLARLESSTTVEAPARAQQPRR